MADIYKLDSGKVFAAVPLEVQGVEVLPLDPLKEVCEPIRIPCKTLVIQKALIHLQGYKQVNYGDFGETRLIGAVYRDECYDYWTVVNEEWLPIFRGYYGWHLDEMKMGICPPSRELAPSEVKIRTALLEYLESLGIDYSGADQSEEKTAAAIWVSKIT